MSFVRLLTLLSILDLSTIRILKLLILSLFNLKLIDKATSTPATPPPWIRIFGKTISLPIFF